MERLVRVAILRRSYSVLKSSSLASEAEVIEAGREYIAETEGLFRETEKVLRRIEDMQRGGGGEEEVKQVTNKPTEINFRTNICRSMRTTPSWPPRRTTPPT